jgi:hypothetical protein
MFAYCGSGKISNRALIFIVNSSLTVFEHPNKMAEIIEFRAKTPKKDAETRPDVSDVIEGVMSRYQWRYGSDEYWIFLKSNHRLPSPVEARCLGKLVGHQVQGSDNKMYPEATKSQRASKFQARKLGKEQSRQITQTLLLVDALQVLSSIQDLPEVSRLQLSEGDQVQVANHLEDAVSWLARFAESWQKNVELTKRSTTQQNSRCNTQVNRQ